ncbi:MAG: helix-turn-helix domain-containing protein [Deltaproteobacteria bacterium]|jgi:DNA-binding Xre family transcriptional regulator|nr:helix-turn-helix domain-containing protein [Deltaproteobacteria bacterium]
MFTSNIKEIMKKKKMAIRDMVAVTGLSSKTINKARQDDGISECRLSTLARIGGALGVKTKRLYDETDGPAPAEDE